MAPGRLLILFRRMMLTASVPAGPPVCDDCSSGSAAASESRVVTSFLFGRRLRGFFVADFVILDIKAACLMCLLSLLVDGKSEVPEFDQSAPCIEDEDDFSADFRDLGAL